MNNIPVCFSLISYIILLHLCFNLKQISYDLSTIINVNVRKMRLLLEFLALGLLILSITSLIFAL